LPEQREATVRYYNEVIDLASDLSAKNVLHIISRFVYKGRASFL
jgi:hypothetical protein